MRGSHHTTGHLDAVFFRGAFLLHCGVIFSWALSLLHCDTVFFLAQFFSPWRNFFCIVSLAYITIHAVSKQKGKTTPTQSNGAI
jgi:hypothetical protein